METYRIIERLEAVVSEFLNGETYTYSLSVRSRERELEGIFEDSTNGIVRDLENDYDFLYQQDCDITIDAFKEKMRLLQERVESLKALFERAQEMPSDENDDMDPMKIQESFCERMIGFIDSLIEKVQGWRESALTEKEANNCYFEDVRFEEEDLPRIYNNLVRNGWISGRRTSLNDFIYLFTGKGFRPAHPVLWKKGQDELCLFLEEMTFDKKDLKKAVLVFEKSGYVLDSRRLSTVRSRINNRRPYDKEKKLKVMYRDIFEFPDWKELAHSRAFD